MGQNGEGRTTYRRFERWMSPSLFVISLYLVLSVRFLHVISRYSVNIFFGDAWGTEYPVLSHPQSLWGLFYLQFGPHRQGLGALFSFLVGNSSHWNSRTETLATALVVVIAAGLALYLKTRVYGPITYHDVIIPAIMLTPSQLPAFAAYINPAHGPFPALLMTLYCLAWTANYPAWRHALVLLTGFAMTYTGFGIFIGVLTPIFLALAWYLQARSRWGLIPILISVVLFVTFFIGYQFQPAVGCYGAEHGETISLSFTQFSGYLHFVSLMLANFFAIKGTSLYPTVVGALILAVLLLSFAYVLRMLSQGTSVTPWLQRFVPAMLLSYSLLFAGATAVGRLCVGQVGAQHARYMPYLALGLLGLYFHLLRSRNAIALTILLIAALISSITIPSTDRQTMLWLNAGKREWKSCYLSLHDVYKCNEQTRFRIDWDPEPAHLQDKLEYLEKHELNLFYE